MDTDIVAPERSITDGAREMPKVLVLSRSYPNNVFDVLGLWVQSLVQHSIRFCEPKVISPVPYFPPLPGLPQYTRSRNIVRYRCSHGVEVFHPRFIVGPGYSLHKWEWLTYYMGVLRCAERIRKTFPFDLIHAHFVYPDGVVAARLGARFNVPIIITEQATWHPWMDNYPTVRRRAIKAARKAAFFVAISSSVRSSVTDFTGALDNMRVVPDGVDGSVFTLPPNGSARVPNQILFVGAIRPVKGADVLLHAIRHVVDSGYRPRLIIVGESYYGPYHVHYEEIRRLASELGISAYVEFAGKKSLPELVRHMQESAVLVLPSRAESLGMVLVEALACGTPVVATRCGGPDDIVHKGVGVLVPPENPSALAEGIIEVMRKSSHYDPRALREYALENFGLASVGHRMTQLYRLALERSSRTQTQTLGQ